MQQSNESSLNDVDDGTLVQRFLADRSGDAFAEIVCRHIPAIYAAAQRQTRNSTLADDITQAVFIVLAKRADTITHMKTIGGWLLKVTRFCAIDAMRKEQRQRRYEQRAAAERSERIESHSTSIADDWHELSPILDEAMATLSDSDRDAIYLRYFQNQPLNEVGTRLGTGEEAARKRVSRAIERLRAALIRRGAAASSASLAGWMGSHAIGATVPPTLVSAVVSGAASNIASNSLGLSLAKGAIQIMAWTKVKIVAVAAVAALLIGGGAAIVISAEGPTTQAAGPASKPAPPADPNPALQTPVVSDQTLAGQIAATKGVLEAYELSLDAFEIDNGRYPTMQEGLSALIQRPAGATKWHGPYVRNLLSDAWGQPFRYVYPAKHSAQGGYDLSSDGPPNAPGIEINNWSQRQAN